LILGTNLLLYLVPKSPHGQKLKFVRCFGRTDAVIEVCSKNVVDSDIAAYVQR
jgi:hypothetical protein